MLCHNSTNNGGTRRKKNIGPQSDQSDKVHQSDTGVNAAELHTQIQAVLGAHFVDYRCLDLTTRAGVVVVHVMCGVATPDALFGGLV